MGFLENLKYLYTIINTHRVRLSASNEIWAVVNDKLACIR